MEGEGPQAASPVRDRPGRSHRGHDPDHRRHRGHQPRPRHLPPRRRRDAQHGADRRHRQGLCAGRRQPPGRRADRPDPGRRAVQPGPPGRLQGREHPRRAGARLRQADPDDRDRRHGHSGRRARLCGADPPGPAAAVRPLRREPGPHAVLADDRPGGADGRGERRPTPTSSTATFSRRSTSWSCRCAAPTA